MKRLSSACALVVLSAAFSAAEFRNLASVHDASGVMSTNTLSLAGVLWTNVSAAAQPGGIRTTAGGGWTHLAGFLQAADVKRLGLDSDADGVPDELETDNDGDGLADATEIEGGAFNPNTPTIVNARDSDADGVSDGQEMVAGTDPRDATALLRITAIAGAGTDRIIGWSARADGLKAYKLLVAETNSYGDGLSWQAVATNTYVGGTAPWYQAAVAHTNAGAISNRFYAVQPLP